MIGFSTPQDIWSDPAKHGIRTRDFLPNLGAAFGTGHVEVGDMWTLTVLIESTEFDLLVLLSIPASSK